MLNLGVCALALVTYAGVILVGAKVATILDNKDKEDTTKED